MRTATATRAATGVGTGAGSLHRRTAAAAAPARGLPASAMALVMALVAALVLAVAPLAGAAAQTDAQRLKLLEQTVRELLERDEARERKMKAMQAELDRLRRGRTLTRTAPRRGAAPAATGGGTAAPADRHAGHGHGDGDGHGHGHGDGHGAGAAGQAGDHGGHGAGEVWSARVGDGVLRLARLGLDVDFAMGGSTAKGEEMEGLFGGHHDPKRTGFTLQSVDLSASGSYDPWFDAAFNAALTVDGAGATAVEIEEAWARSKWLAGDRLRLQAGQLLTPFGLVNRSHLHDRDWQTQPVIATRAFGADGARGLGLQAEARLYRGSAWRSNLLVSMQNRRSVHTHGAHEEGEAHAGEENGHAGEEADEAEDAHADEEAHAEEAVPDADGLDDFAWTVRLENRFQLSPRTALGFGASALFEPDPDGSDSPVAVYGADLTARHRLASKNRLAFRAEYLHRFSQEMHEEERHRLQDYGFYLQGMWYRRDGFGAGLRYELAGSRGGEAEEITADPLRGRRTRISPLLLWQFSELGRLKLQYIWDRADFLEDSQAHSLFLSASWSFGLGAPTHAGHGH